MIHIVGGAKTGVNLFLYLKSLQIPAELYFFPKEYAERKRLGKPFFQSWTGARSFSGKNLVIVSSETGFVHLPKEDRIMFGSHYYLRDKLNISQIAKMINTDFIEDLNGPVFQFPLAVKPKESSLGKVPFKFKKINNKEELDRIQDVLQFCLIQPYLSDDLHRQIAIAGYFDGHASSLVAVHQKNQYPKGISAYVIDQTQAFRSVIEKISEFLNSLGYRGFLELEFKMKAVTQELYLMDINPRPWGWFYYYLNGMTNFKEVILRGSMVQVTLKPAWVNPLRLAAANIKGNYVLPSITDFYKGNICYEPIF